MVGRARSHPQPRTQRASIAPAHCGACQTLLVREWTVGGAVLESADGLLLVRNRRASGDHDWTPPGGVIDSSDATLLDGLTREVVEETGLTVHRWEGPLYRVIAEAPDLGWRMHCEVHRALQFSGELVIADPDGIVVDAAFVDVVETDVRLADGHMWVREPLQAWLAERWDGVATREFRYCVRGATPAEFVVERTQ